MRKPEGKGEGRKNENGRRTGERRGKKGKKEKKRRATSLLSSRRLGKKVWSTGRREKKKRKSTICIIALSHRLSDTWGQGEGKPLVPWRAGKKEERARSIFSPVQGGI